MNNNITGILYDNVLFKKQFKKHNATLILISLRFTFIVNFYVVTFGCHFVVCCIVLRQENITLPHPKQT